MNKLLLPLLFCFVAVYGSGCGHKTETKEAEQPVTEEIVDFNKEQPSETSQEAGQATGAAGTSQVAGQEAQTSQEVISSFETLTVQQQQEALKAAGFYQGKVDGSYGPMTKKSVEDFQLQNGLTVSGKVDLATWGKLRPYLATAAQGAAEGSLSGMPSNYQTPTGKDIQEALKNAKVYQGKIDGVVGPMTKKAVEDFQKQNGLAADGKVGPKTWAKLRTYLAGVQTTVPLDAAQPQADAQANQ